MDKKTKAAIQRRLKGEEDPLMRVAKRLGNTSPDVMRALRSVVGSTEK